MAVVLEKIRTAVAALIIAAALVTSVGTEPRGVGESEPVGCEYRR